MFFWGCHLWNYCSTLNIITYLCGIYLNIIRKNPVNLFEKPLIVNIPCHSENADILKGTIDAIVQMDYANNLKFLFLVSDGQVIGKGNSASHTPTSS